MSKGGRVAPHGALGAKVVTPAVCASAHTSGMRLACSVVSKAPTEPRRRLQSREHFSSRSASGSRLVVCTFVMNASIPHLPRAGMSQDELQRARARVEAAMAAAHTSAVPPRSGPAVAPPPPPPPPPTVVAAPVAKMPTTDVVSAWLQRRQHDWQRRAAFGAITAFPAVPLLSLVSTVHIVNTERESMSRVAPPHAHVKRVGGGGIVCSTHACAPPSSAQACLGALTCCPAAVCEGPCGGSPLASPLRCTSVRVCPRGGGGADATDACHSPPPPHHHHPLRTRPALEEALRPVTWRWRLQGDARQLPIRIAPNAAAAGGGGDERGQAAGDHIWRVQPGNGLSTVLAGERVCAWGVQPGNGLSTVLAGERVCACGVQPGNGLSTVLAGERVCACGVQPGNGLSTVLAGERVCACGVQPGAGRIQGGERDGRRVLWQG
jgi:hypothetical protein